MNKKLIIIGSGNVAGYIVHNLSLFGFRYDIVGFCDNDASRIGKKIWGLSIFPMEFLNTLKGQMDIAIAISKPSIKEKVASELMQLSAFNKNVKFNFPNFIPDNVWLSEKVKIGYGNILYPGTSINYETVIGNFITINMNCAIGHNSSLGDFSTLAPGVNLAGFSILEKGVEMGIGSCTRQNVHIGQFARIGGQSMVISDVPSNTLVAGIPAKILKSY